MARSPRREFSRKVRAEIVARATSQDGRITCETCGLVLGRKKFEIDHTIAEGLIVDKSKPLTAKDGKLLGKSCCHRAPGGKTATDVAIIAQAKRRQDKDSGAVRPAGKIKSPGFPPAKARQGKPPLAPRAMFAPLRSRGFPPNLQETSDV